MTEAQRLARLARLKRRAVLMGVAGDADDDEEVPVERVPRDVALERTFTPGIEVFPGGRWSQ